MSNINWKPGDIAICISAGHLEGQKGNPPPVRLKAEYLVQDVRTCECKCITLDVGLSNGTGKGVECGCGAKSSPTSGIWWCHSLRFTKKLTNTEVEEQIEEALAQENYELAQELTNQLPK